MEIYNSPKTLEKNLQKYEIRNAFSRIMPEFQYVCFKKGECLTSPYINNAYFFFIISGNCKIYYIGVDGKEFYISDIRGFNILGESEFIEAQYDSIYVEATTDVKCIVFSMIDYRSILLQDPVFLLYVARSISRKLENVRYAHYSVKSRIINYIANSENGCINSIKDLAFAANASSRQVIRKLNELCDDGIIEKLGKGSYKLIK